MNIKPENMKAIIIESGKEISIQIPSKKSRFMLLLMFFSLCLCTLAVLNAIFVKHHYETWQIYSLIIGVTGGGNTLYTLLWILTGKEFVTIFPDKLTYEKRIIGYSWRREYELSRSKRFRLKEPEKTRWYKRPGFSKGDIVGETMIVFDYCDVSGVRDKTVGFCQGIDKAEAQYLLGIIQKKKTKYDFINAHRR